MIKNGEQVNTYVYSEISNFKINRGSTFHKTGEDYIQKFNNWVRFDLHDEQHEYEFLMESMAHNESFEMMINRLRRNKKGLKYYSI